jgi:hypothetical protein
LLAYLISYTVFIYLFIIIFYFYYDYTVLLLFYFIFSDDAGNETVKAYDIIQFLATNNYELFCDHWNEQNLYFGKYHDKIQEIDTLFGSDKFKLYPDISILNKAAAKILSQPLEATTFNHQHFLRSWTDVIAIEKSLAERMKAKFIST